MKIPPNLNISRSEWEKLIDEWVLNEKYRKMLKLNLLDGWTYERIAEEVDMSARHTARILPPLTKKLFKHIK